MTLEFAIQHCLDIAENKDRDVEVWERTARYWCDDKQVALDKADECKQCAAEHRQLAEWLRLLKEILESGDCNDCLRKHNGCRYAPELGELVRYNCPFYSAEVEDGQKKGKN